MALEGRGVVATGRRAELCLLGRLVPLIRDRISAIILACSFLCCRHDSLSTTQRWVLWLILSHKNAQSEWLIDS